MNKITIIKSETSPFLKRGDSIYADVNQLRLLHVDKKLETEYATLYEHNLGSSCALPSEKHQVGLFNKSFKPESVRWKPVELERYNQKVREELQDSQLIICENEIIKELINQILDSDDQIIITL